MQLAIFNGSPRLKKSNSRLLIKHFLNGFNGKSPTDCTIHYLANTKKNEEHREAFEKADTVIVIFPLYTDAMPGQVKHFFESIEEINSRGKKVGFIVQSGFPEAIHSTYIERYLDKLAKSMKWNYSGTVIKGGVEGIQIMPANMTKKLFSQFEKLGQHYALTGEFEAKTVKQLRSPYKMSPLRRSLFKFMLFIGVADFYWKKKLKENKAWKIRYAQPYRA